MWSVLGAMVGWAVTLLGWLVGWLSVGSNLELLMGGGKDGLGWDGWLDAV